MSSSQVHVHIDVCCGTAEMPASSIWKIMPGILKNLEAGCHGNHAVTPPTRPLSFYLLQYS